jgi:hypothetical protein
MQSGDVAQLVRALPCHGRGRGFEPRRPRHKHEKRNSLWHRFTLLGYRSFRFQPQATNSMTPYYWRPFRRGDRSRVDT